MWARPFNITGLNQIGFKSPVGRFQQNLIPGARVHSESGHYGAKYVHAFTAIEYALLLTSEVVQKLEQHTLQFVFFNLLNCHSAGIISESSSYAECILMLGKTEC